MLSGSLYLINFQRFEEILVRKGVIFRDADGSNEITILYEWDNLENAHKLTQSEDLRKAMQKAGVIGNPDFLFLEEIGKTPA
jgi:hypothetical protein